MKRRPPLENTARVIALAAALTAGGLALGIVEGVFAKLDPFALAALAAFALAYAGLTYWLDRRVRALVNAAWHHVAPRWSKVRSAAAKSPGATPAAT